MLPHGSWQMPQAVWRYIRWLGVIAWYAYHTIAWYAYYAVAMYAYHAKVLIKYVTRDTLYGKYAPFSLIPISSLPSPLPCPSARRLPLPPLPAVPAFPSPGGFLRVCVGGDVCGEWKIYLQMLAWGMVKCLSLQSFNFFIFAGYWACESRIPWWVSSI